MSISNMFEAEFSSIPATVSLHPDTVHEVPPLNVAVDAASGIVATFEFSVKGESSVMIERLLLCVSAEYTGWIQKVACGNHARTVLQGVARCATSHCGQQTQD